MHLVWRTKEIISRRERDRCREREREGGVGGVSERALASVCSLLSSNHVLLF